MFYCGVYTAFPHAHPMRSTSSFNDGVLTCELSIKEGIQEDFEEDVILFKEVIYETKHWK